MGPARDQRAAHPGDHRADDGPAAGPRRARRGPSSLACLGLRLVHYAVAAARSSSTSILGGLDAFTGSYETLTGWLGFVPQGAAPRRVAVTAVGQLLWADLLQHGPGRRLPARAAATGRRRAARRARRAAGGGGRTSAQPARFDPRAVARRRAARDRAAAQRHRVAAAARRHRVARPGLAALARRQRRGAARRSALAALLAVRRAHRRPAQRRRARAHAAARLRAVLLVAVATWMRAAAGAGGLREIFRRALRPPARGSRRCARRRAARRARQRPAAVAAGRAAADRFADVELKPAELCDTVTAWVAAESGGFRPGPPAPARGCGCERRTPLLVALTLAPALALLPG